MTTPTKPETAATASEEFLKQNSGQASSRTAEYITVPNAREYAKMCVNEIALKISLTDREIGKIVGDLWVDESIKNQEELGKAIRSQLLPILSSREQEVERLKEALKNLLKESEDLMDFCIDRKYLNTEDLTDGQKLFNEATKSARTALTNTK